MTEKHKNSIQKFILQIMTLDMFYETIYSFGSIAVECERGE